MIIERVCAAIDWRRTGARGGELTAPVMSVGAGSVRA